MNDGETGLADCLARLLSATVEVDRRCASERERQEFEAAREEAATTSTTTGTSDMAKTFASLDTDGNGQLSMDELTKAFAQAMAQQHRFAKPFWEGADPSTTAGSTQSVTA